jgi:alpha-tubulin suppressor-like RCC1 family protein
VPGEIVQRGTAFTNQPTVRAGFPHVAAVLITSLTLAAGGMGCTDTATPTKPAPVKLAFLTQPGDGIAGQAIAPSVRVAIEDASGTPVSDATGAVTLALGTNPGGGTLSGTLTATAAAGVATFGGLSLDKSGVGYALAATADGLAGATSTSFAIRGAAPSRLVFTGQPSAAQGLQPIAPAVQITLEDVFGNVAQDATDSVSLALATNPSGGTLSGTVTVLPTNGVATFPTLMIDAPGAGYTLVASADTLPTVTSSAFTVALTFAQVSAGYYVTCGVTVAGPAYCWGGDIFGELGDSMTTASKVPVAVHGGHAFTSVGAAEIAVCGVATAGAMFCWGEGRHAGTVPVALPGGLTFATVSAGNASFCAVTTAGGAYCWNDTIGWNVTPAAVPGGLTWAQVSVADYSTCGITRDGAAYCWGDNSHFQLGNGTWNPSTTPVAVSGGLTFATVSTRYYNACGVTTGGAAYCWGDDSLGQLGRGTNYASAVPAAVSGGLTFATVSTGKYYACGLTAAGAAYCWGNNAHGELGNGTTTSSNVPVPVSGGLSFASISAGYFYTCGVTPAGAAYCWGDGPSGQLGSGPTVASLVPVQVVQ